MKLGGNRIYYYDISSFSIMLNTLFNIPLAKKGIDLLIKQYTPSKYISEYEGAFFLIENNTVDLTNSFFCDMRISDSIAVKTYKKHYSTNRIDTVAKFFIQDKIRNFLRFYYQVKHSKESITIIVSENELYRYILEKNPFKASKHVPVVFSGFKVFRFLNGVELFLANLLETCVSLFKQKYTFRRVKKQKYRVCMRAHFPKNEGLLRNDFLIDGKKIQVDDVLFFVDGKEDKHVKEMAGFYRKGNYNYTVLKDLKVPISFLPAIIADYILLPSKIFLCYLIEKKWISFNVLLAFSRAAMKIKYEILFCYNEIGMLILFHSGGSEMVIAPVLSARHHSKFGIYNFGSTVSWGRWAPYAFQASDCYFAWGEKIVSLYSPTCEFDEIIKAGFWGKEEYQKISSKRDELKKEIAGENEKNSVITFYDLPYFCERSTFRAEHLFDFYRAALACSKLDDVTVILKMKSKYNINDAKYPESIKPLFKKLWEEIEGSRNIIIIDTSNYDPLHIVAVSDINVTLELSSPSTIALICGEVGIFYNVVFDFANHSLYPEYLDKLIFNDTDKMVNAIKKHLRNEINFKAIAKDANLEDYDEHRDNNGLTRLIQAVRERTSSN
ncbi:MAG: hypothetical protein HON76_14575 [Candidatus Scalindua sp.]|nr:hypothetical protein [Candidatus Scalindua sp.]